MNGALNSASGLLALYGLVVAVASLTGGWVLLMMRLGHARLQVAVSLVAGLMLGMALLHFIPEAVEQSHSPAAAMQWTLAGFIRDVLPATFPVLPSP